MARSIATTGWYTNSQLKAYYQFEAGALATDSSGEGHNLTAISDPAAGTGRLGGGVTFDSTDAYSFAEDADFKPTTDFTVGLWLKRGGATTTGGIFQSYNYESSKIAGIRISTLPTSGYVRFLTGNNTGAVDGTHFKYVTSTVSVTDNSWHFVVLTWAADTDLLTVYIDGVSNNTESWANAPAYSATPLIRIGCYSTGTNDNFFDGSMDDFFLINGTALTETEVKSIYEGGGQKVIVI